MFDVTNHDIISKELKIVSFSQRLIPIAVAWGFELQRFAERKGRQLYEKSSRRRFGDGWVGSQGLTK